MKEIRLTKLLVVNFLVFLLMVLLMLLLTASFAIGGFGAYFLVRTWLINNQGFGLAEHAISSISMWTGLVGASFFGYLCGYWIVHALPNQPSYTIWSKDSKKSKSIQKNMDE